MHLCRKSKCFRELLRSHGIVNSSNASLTLMERELIYGKHGIPLFNFLLVPSLADDRQALDRLRIKLKPFKYIQKFISVFIFRITEYVLVRDSTSTVLEDITVATVNIDCPTQVRGPQ